MANYSVLVYNRDESQTKAVLAPRASVDVTVTEEINRPGHCRVTLPLDMALSPPRSAQIQEFDVIWIGDIDSGFERRFRVMQTFVDKERLRFRIEAEGLLLDLVRTQFVLDGRHDVDYTSTGNGKFVAMNATVTTVLTEVLKRTGFSVGTVSAALDASPKEYQFRNETSLSVLQKIVEKYKETYANVGFRLNSDNTIDFVSDLAQNTGAYIISRKNMKTVGEERDARRYANRVWAWGARANWQHVHSGIESSIQTVTAETAINPTTVFVDVNTESFKWKFGDSADLIYSPKISTIGAGSSARTVALNTTPLGALEENEYRGGVIGIFSGELSGVYRSIDGNDTSGNFALNSELHFVNGLTDIVGESARVAKKVLAVDCLGFHVKTGRADSGTVNSLADSDASFEASVYANGLVEILSGDPKGSVKKVTGNSTTVLGFEAMSTAVDADDTYWVTSNTPSGGAISISELDEEPEPTGGDVMVKRVIDFGAGLTIGKHPKFSSYVNSVDTTAQSPTPVHLPTDASSKFSTYQVIDIYASSVNSLDRARHFVHNQVEVGSVAPGVIYVNETPAPIPVKGDSIEILTLVDGIGISSWGAAEGVYRGNEADPWELYLNATDYLTDVSEVKKRYEIDCVDLYQVDPVAYSFDQFNVGDTLSVHDAETDINVKDLRVVRKVWKPLTPWVVESLEVSNQRRALDTETARTAVNVKAQGDRLGVAEREAQYPTCRWWDDKQKVCVRPNPHNTFCESVRGNRDGKLTADKAPISGGDCPSFSPPSKKAQFRTDSRYASGTVTGVTNTTFDNTSRFSVDIPVIVDADSFAEVVAVIDEAAKTGTAQSGTGTTIRLAAGESSADDIYNNWFCELTGGTGNGQTQLVTDYVGSTKDATVASWSPSPDGTTTYSLTSGFGLDTTVAEARIQVDANGFVVPFDTKTGRGCYVQVRRLSGSATLTIRALATIIGVDG